MILKLMTAAASLSLATTPALAAPRNDAASLSVAKAVRAKSSTGKERGLVGGNLVAAALAAVAVVIGVVLIADDDGDSDSN